jgi:hypothetical protein
MDLKKIDFEHGKCCYCPMADFGISDFELLGFVTMVLISLLIGYW